MRSLFRRGNFINFQELEKLLSYSFVQKAFLVGAMGSVCAAVLGCILVLKRFSLIGHSLADVGFTATILSVSLGISPTIFCIPIMIGCSFFIMYLSQKKKMHGDIAIGIFSTGALAVGALISSTSSGFTADVYGYMFGSILALSSIEVFLGIFLSIIILALFLIFYNKFFLITCDESFAKSSGINLDFYNFLISLMTALTIVIGMRIMGTLLISSLIIFPAVIARKISKGFKYLIIFSVIISCVCFILGMLASCVLNTPTGASVVAINIIVLCLVSIVKKFFRQ